MKKSFLVLSSILVLFALTVTSCKKDDSVFDDFVGSTWVAGGGYTVTLSFPNKTGVIIKAYTYGTVTLSGTYTKNGNTVSMTFPSENAKLVGTINGGTMTVINEEGGNPEIFIKQ